MQSSKSHWPFQPRNASTGCLDEGMPCEGAAPAGSRPTSPGAPGSPGSPVRRQSIAQYHTFPTMPPKAPSEAPSTPPCAGRRRGPGGATPLPLRQLGVLALLSLAEQTALNSIGPYLPGMVASFSEIPEEQMGLYVGLLASAFALAQLATNLLWGYLSDIVGRKPVMLAGTFLLMLCFCFFGFCTTYWQVVVVHVAMGLLNGNVAVVPTCLGEVTDRTNQGSVFTWLPVMYSLGSITGPALGGLLVGGADAHYPFLGPNLASAALLGLSVVALALWFDETLRTVADDATDTTAVGSLRRLFGTAVPRETEVEVEALLGREEDAKPTHVLRQLLKYKTVLLLLTYLVFQLSNTSFNSLYPMFCAAAEPTGRDLTPGDIGLLLSFAGIVTIVFQVTAFQPMRARLGSLGTYRVALFGLAVTMLAMPWVGHIDDRPLFGRATGEWWLYVEMAAVLVVKNICAVGGLSSVMLLITNSAPSHETLGTLNGIAQTLSAAGRSVGPFVSGALFTLSTQLQPKGELLVWGVFGCVAAFGWLGGLVVEGHGLESAGWDEEPEEPERADEER